MSWIGFDPVVDLGSRKKMPALHISSLCNLDKKNEIYFEAFCTGEFVLENVTVSDVAPASCFLRI